MAFVVASQSSATLEPVAAVLNNFCTFETLKFILLIAAHISPFSASCYLKVYQTPFQLKVEASSFPFCRSPF